MLKRILLLLAETEAGIAARSLAFDIAALARSTVTGLAGVDTALAHAMPGRVGSAAYVAAMQQQLRQEASKSSERLHSAFAAEGESAGVPVEVLRFDGDALETLRETAATRDLVVTPYDVRFRAGSPRKGSELIRSLLLETARPVIVCPSSSIRLPVKFMLAYDGSLPAMRTIQFLALLGIGRANEIVVTSVSGENDLAARLAGSAASFLRMHGYVARENPIVSERSPEDLLRDEVARLGVTALAMGGYGHTGLRELIFGSTSRGITGAPPCPLFLSH